MTKPVIKSELFNTIIEATGAGTSSNQQEPSNRIIAEKSLRVLLVEDGLINQRVATGLLEQAGHRVSVANNGREAVEAVRDEEFDVVLMDLQMPVLDGFAATQRIRREEKESGRRVRIVAMTAAAMSGDREECLANGMDAYVSKPIDRTTLLAALSPQGHPPIDSTIPTREGSVSKLFDFEAAKSRVPGGEKVLVDLAHLFLEEGLRLTKELESGFQSNDLKRAKRAAHTLTSSCKTIFATHLAQQAGELEELLNRGEINAARDRFSSLETTTQDTIDAVRRWLG